MNMSENVLSATSAALPKQFLVTRERLAPKPGWQRSKLGDFYIYRGPGVGMTRLVHSEGGTTPETVVIGWFCYRDTFCPGSGTDELRIEGSVEDVYPEMTGRFAVLSLHGNRLFCSTDAGAQFPVVYRQETGDLGSTPLVLGWTRPLEKAPQVTQEFTRIDGTLWYPFGATPFAGVERLLPQQSVVVDASGAKLSDRKPPTLIPLSVEQMHDMASDSMRSLVLSQGDIECHLTAGWDSRMVLSASWQLRHGIHYLTYLADGASARVDAEVASYIAQRFDLNHQTIPVSSPSRSDIDCWLTRTSGCIDDSVMNLTKTVVATYADRYGMAGVGGEVGRAFYWNKYDIDRKGLTPEQLLDRLGFGQTSHVLSRADRWLQRYRDQSRTHILDRAYIDIRLGCWAGPSLGGHLVDKPTLSPFNSLAIYESMIAMPESYRLSGAFARDFISQGSVDLARIPVNRRAGIRRLRGLPREMARMLPKGTKARLRNLLLSKAPV